MSGDDHDFSELAHVLEDGPSLPVPVVPVYDLGRLEGLPARERFATATRLIEQVSAAQAVFTNSCREAYFKALEEAWRGVARGRKAFNVAQAEREIPSVAASLAEAYRGQADAGRAEFEQRAEQIRAFRREAANECEIAPAARSWYYRDSYVDGYRTQPAAETYARVRIELYAAELAAWGVKYEIKRHDSNGLPFFVLYAFCDEADIPVLKARDGLPLAELVRLSWSLGANPRVYWPSLPHGFEQRHGFDQFGRGLAKKSEPHEPEPL